MFRSKSNAPKSASTSLGSSNTPITSNTPKPSDVSSTTTGPKDAAQGRKDAREGGLRIKKLQEDALKALPQRKLYVFLHVRTDPPEANNFHWGLYYHKDEDGSTKYHITSPGRGWIADHRSEAGVFKSQFLRVLVQIGGIPATKEATLHQIMGSQDHSLNNIPGLTCRVWIFKILSLLIRSQPSALRRLG